MKIVITDSGLGGLSVLAELDKFFGANPFFEKTELVFINSLHSSKNGYNSMPDMETKARVFNNALTAIENLHHPDVILIACNTLSVVYPYTYFAEKSTTPVIGIVESGVELFKKSLTNNGGKIILFGTPTTINSNVYRDKLTSAGIDNSQIISQSCPNLETTIQNNPLGKQAQKEISFFLDSALKKIQPDFKKLYVGLCCTHYGYSHQVFSKLLKNKLINDFKILNPNNTFIDFFLNNYKPSNLETKIFVRIISQVRILPEEQEALGNILRTVSVRTAKALFDYELVADNFFELK